MFRATDRDSREPVTLPDLTREEVESLRPRAREGRLACPACGSDVLVRAGEVLRWHFAHREIADCPLESEPAERLALREMLYRWLGTKCPGRAEVEVPFPDLALARPADVVVAAESGRRFAYWVPPVSG